MKRTRKVLGTVVRRIPVLHALYRLKVALSYFRVPFKHVAIWLVESREDANFTHDRRSSARGGS